LPRPGDIMSDIPRHWIPPAPPASWRVDEQGQRWFLYRPGMQYFDIPFGLTHVAVLEGVTRIEERAFDNEGERKFDALKVVQLAPTVEVIGGFAFHGCHNLVTVKIPTDSNLSVIENVAFEECHSLQDITLPPSLRHLRSTAFSECRSLRLLRFPPQLEEALGDHYCFNDSGLTEVDLGQCHLLTSITDHTFSNCKKLETVVLPPNLERIDEVAFQGCTALKAIAFPRALQFILESAFEDCSALTTLEFDSFASIAAIMKNPRDAIFPGCMQLHTVKWSPKPGPAIPPAIWSQIISKIVGSEVGLLESLPAKNRHSCIFSFLCSIQEELMEHQVGSTSPRHIRQLAPHPMETRDSEKMRKTMGSG